VACANGKLGASGVAPQARLMPIRNATALGSIEEAKAFAWAADHGADVISCSWGPRDGDPTDSTDPLHKQVTPLPDSTRLAIEHAVQKGRRGKGCVIVWAAGNGNESVDNDHYAANPHVIAVAACNDRGKRSMYSDFGQAVWCCFPSSDKGPPKPLTPGIWTTDRGGQEGYNPHFGGGDADHKYTDSFGGTSSSCPGVAGVAALMLSMNASLTWQEVKERIKKSCDRIDKKNGEYDGERHSPMYGYGRVNAKKAVKLA
jgi:subtilisin family serine protease